MPPQSTRSVSSGELRGDGKHRWFCLAYFAPNRCRDQPQKRPVVQSHGITLSFHREMADASREFVGPDVAAAVSFESYPRFIKGGFQDYEGLGVKRPTANSKNVPLTTIEVARKQRSWSLPQKVVKFLAPTGTSGGSSPIEAVEKRVVASRIGGRNMIWLSHLIGAATLTTIVERNARSRCRMSFWIRI